jgi:hypothetical protein
LEATVSKKKGNRRHKQAKARKPTRRDTTRDEAVDRRGVSANVEAMGGVPVQEPTQIVLIEPIRLDTGEALYFQAPFVETFYLLKAKALRDRAEPKRLRTVTRTVATPDGSLRPRDPRAAFDAIEDLALTVILSAAAIEAYANNAIGRLPDDAMVEVPRRVGGETIVVMRDKGAMDRFALAEKLIRAVPLLTRRDSIKGTDAWQKFRRITRLRNALVHMRREAQNDPDKPGPFGQLVRGDGSRAPEDAALVIEALEPGWIPQNARAALGLPV